MTDLRHHIRELSPELDTLRQNNLLDETGLISFAGDRGIRISGVVSGDPGEFHKRGWLMNDGTSPDGRLLFHPFRLYPLYRILHCAEIRITPSSWVLAHDVEKLVEDVQRYVPSPPELAALAAEANTIADLAIILEPIYWPRITGRVSYRVYSEGQHEALTHTYRDRVLPILKSLDVEEWRRLHDRLRTDAIELDPNGHLYVLLRAARYAERQRSKGAIAGALWVRHIAELIRRGFEDVSAARWPEEDRGHEQWMPGGRTMAYGSDRPLDQIRDTARHLARKFGLLSGSAVRWYVEGDTEYHAVLEILPDSSSVGIELVNLRGNVEAERGNIALALRDGLKEDKRLKRFSLISFDRDVEANVRTVRRQVKSGNVIGLIAGHEPDFEFANFAIGELAEIAARLDKEGGVSGDAVRHADWNGIDSGRAFEKRYIDVSATRPRGLKGERWGRALASYAAQHPRRSDNGAERPFWREIRAAVIATSVQYDYHAKTYAFDPQTFELVERRALKH